MKRVHNKAPQRYILSTRAMDKTRFEMLWSPSYNPVTAEAAQGREEDSEPLLHSWNLIPGRDEHEISSSRKITPCIVFVVPGRPRRPDLRPGPKSIARKPLLVNPLATAHREIKGVAKVKWNSSGWRGKTKCETEECAMQIHDIPTCHLSIE